MSVSNLHSGKIPLSTACPLVRETANQGGIGPDPSAPALPGSIFAAGPGHHPGGGKHPRHGDKAQLMVRAAPDGATWCFPTLHTNDRSRGHFRGWSTWGSSPTCCRPV